jgi:Domain of unknown function (DUF4145)
MTRKWHGEIVLAPRRYDCGYCNSVVGPDKGIFSQEGHSPQTYIYFCSHYGQPTYFDGNSRQFPGAKFGKDVKHLPKEIEQLYGEARAATSALAYTPAVLACRKILMNVAVSLGAKEGDPFVSYVQFLADKGYIPPNGKHWVDHIRTKSNEANHEITLMSKDEAEKLITFVEMMLKFIFELPKVVPATVSTN